MARRRSKTFRLVLRALLAVALVLVVSAIVYSIYLDKIITKQFEGRRWTLPAKVYAAPMELYVGLALPAGAIEHELQRLQYRNATSLARPGEYRRRGSRLDVA